MKSRLIILWIIWTLVGAGLIYIISAAESDNNPVSIIANIISLAPIMGMMLALGAPKALQQFKVWLQNDENSLHYIAGGFTLLFAVPGILKISFNPYYTVIFAFMVWSILGSLKQLKSESFSLTWMDLAFWVLLWIPFDLRWTTDMLPSLGYTWWSMAISVVAVIGWYGFRNAESGYRLVPKIKDLYIALIALAGIMVVVVPLGIISGFLTFAIPEHINGSKLATHFIGLFLTVALPEELFFRGLLLRGLEKATTKKWVPMVVSSLAFGLMHWNNVSDLNTQITYVLLATIAGVGYAWAYKKSGNNLLAAILTHTLVDWIWKLLLAG